MRKLALAPAIALTLLWGCSSPSATQLRKQACATLAILLTLPLVAIWFLPSSPPPARVTYQHATNDLGNGRVGVIELVNNLNETVIVMGAWYVPAKRNDLCVSKDTPAAFIYGDVSKLGARSTNVVQVSLPKNEGPYRLVFQCVPESTNPQRMQGSVRYWIVWRIWRWLHPSQVTVARWLGGFFVVSKSIDLSQSAK